MPELSTQKMSLPSSPIQCPQCNGAGYYIGMAHGIFNGRRGCREIKHTCSFCKGTGNATPEMMARREFGERLRTKRRAERLTLRELCDRIGFADYPMYSRIEHGSHDGDIPLAVKLYVEGINEDDLGESRKEQSQLKIER
jgi:hypothetical protein